MFRKLLTPVLAALILMQLLPVEAFAQRGGGGSRSSGGSSFSSSSSSGRSSFSSSSSSGRSSFSSSSSSSGRSSFSSGSSSSGKSSFSSGSQSSSSKSSSSPSSSKSSFSSSSPSSSSSSSKSSFSSSSSSSKPGSSSSSGKSSFGSSSSSGKSSFGSSSSSSSSKPASSFSSSSSSSGKTTTTTPIAGKTPSSVSQRPASSSFDKLASNDSKKAESRSNYEKSNTPATSYKTPAGKEQKIDPKDKQISYLQGRLDQQKWVNRNNRESVFYGSYYSRPLIVYNDCYHPYWNYWLLSQSIDTMAMWCYHHQMVMDQARLSNMYAQNAGLQARVAALEAQRIPRDPTYTPANVDPDMAYNDGYVNAAYNPRPKTVTVYEYDNAPGAGGILMWVFVYVPLIILATWLIIYFSFVKQYNM